MTAGYANEARRWQAEAKCWQAEAEHGQAEAKRWQAEAEHWRAEAKGLAAQNAALRARVVELEAQVAALSEKVATFAKVAFGASSEKKKLVTSLPAEGAEGGDVSGRRPRGQQPGSHGHGRRDYSALETVEALHDVPEDERVCSVCGAPYAPFGEERAEQIDWRVRIGRVWTIAATATRAGHNPLAHLTAYLDACAQAGGRPPSGEAFARFLPWAASPADRAAGRGVPGGPAP